MLVIPSFKVQQITYSLIKLIQLFIFILHVYNIIHFIISTQTIIKLLRNFILKIKLKTTPIRGMTFIYEISVLLCIILFSPLGNYFFIHFYPYTFLAISRYLFAIVYYIFVL